VDFLDVTINQASIQDLPVLQKIVRDCISLMESQGIHQWDDVYPDQTTLQSDIDTKTLWVARIAGNIAGMIALNEHQEKEYQQLSWQYNGRILVVHRLVVAPSYQRQKLAIRLMRFAEDYAAGKKYDAIRLDAFIQNPFAVGLYRRLEYSQSGTMKFRKGQFYCFEKRIPLPNKTDGVAGCQRQTVQFFKGAGSANA
jgi:ribosomal protein S18 acetylase RimI-like enzyme